MLFAIWSDAPERKGKLLSKEQRLTALNTRRRLKGLPPLTMEQADENERKWHEAIAKAKREGVRHGK